MAEIVKLQAKQTVNNALYYCNRPNIILIHNLLFNFKVLIQHKSCNWTRPYYLLAIENKIYCIQLPSRLTSFKNISIKPYFWPKNNHNIKLDKLEVPIKLDKLEAPAKLDKLEIPLPTLKVFQELTEPIKPIKCG